MANEAKQFTIGGVTHDVMDVGARQLIADLQTAIDAITSGDTTTAIKTFQEVINFLDGVTDDATLIGKLNELRTLINAKYSKPAGGIPASDLAEGVIPDVSGFATKTEVNAKANSADVYDKQTVDQKVAEAGKVKSVSVNGGTPAQPDGNGNVNLVVPAGEKGDKGDTGNVEFEDLADLVALLVNDLTTGGVGNFLSAEMGKRLKAKVDEVEANIQRLYNNLGNIAFWDADAKSAAAPIPIDWGNPKHNVTLNLSLSHAVVKHNGVQKSNGDTIAVEEFSELTLVVEPESGYAITSVTSSTTGAEVTNLGNGIYNVVVAMGNSNITLDITNTAVQSYTIGYNTTNCSAEGQSSISQSGTATIVLTADSGYTMPELAAAVRVTNATLVSYAQDANAPTTATLVISNPTGNVSIRVAAVISIELVKQVFLYTTNTTTIVSVRNETYAPRACILVQRPSEGAFNWNNGSLGYNVEVEENYSLIPIPSGTHTVKAQAQTPYATNKYYGIGLNAVANGGIPIVSAQWVENGALATLDVSSLANSEAFLAFNLKKDTAFTDETFSSIGGILEFYDENDNLILRYTK